MHNAAHYVNGEQSVAQIPTDDELRETLEDLKRYVGVRQIALAADIHWRTLYNQLSADGPERMDQRTRTGLEDLFEELGVLGDYGRKELRAAAKAVAETAATLSAEDVARAGRRARKKLGDASEEEAS